MLILAIETSCDETAMAVLECSGGLRRPQFEILAETVSSQIPIHRPFGGVVPNLAKREHIKNLPVVLEKIYSSMCDRKYFSKIDLIAVTVGPGLEPALWTGINFAEELGKKMGIPVVGANHLEGHIYSNWLPDIHKIEFPAICLIVSGGHTILLLMKSLTKWEILGETRDDAVGEAFDKVAKMLGLPYPGGPEVERLANQFAKRSILSNPPAGGVSKDLIFFPRPMIYEKNYEFSFSGLKTAVLYYLRDQKFNLNKAKKLMKLKILVCASFQKAAIDVLVKKTMRAVEEFEAKSVLLCGGVACNKALQKYLRAGSRKLKAGFFVPDKKFNTDNAVMIAVAAYLSPNKYKIEAQGNLCF